MLVEMAVVAVMVVVVTKNWGNWMSNKTREEDSSAMNHDD